MTAAAVLVGALGTAPAAGADQWFKTDTHVHSSAVSGDAPQDIGVISAIAQQHGIDAIFLTDHTAASTQNIAGVIANHIRFDDDITRWSQLDYSPSGNVSTASANTSQATLAGPTLSSGNTMLCELGAPTTAAAGVTVVGGNSTTNEVVAMPANTGSASLHLASTNSDYGETFAYLKRGPSLHAGQITLKFSVNPTRIDPGSGMFVSMTIGGDDSVAHRPPTGYTPQGGNPSLTKRTMLVWQIGNPKQDSSDPENRVITHQLPYLTGVWNTYTIDVSAALNEIPVADRPNELDGLAIVKMAAAGRGGTADGYFDTFSMDTSADLTQAQEFIYRNQHIHDFDTPSFKIYPGQEAGYQKHVQRFNFGITTPSQFNAWSLGTLSIASTQASGYPAQLDHPGLPGGVTFDEALNTQGEGADGVETAERGEYGLVKNVMIDAWDGILKQGVQILGSWSSDAHKPDRFGPVTYLLAPSIGFDDLMRSYYEGRSYNSLSDFSGRAIFNIDGSATNPYPARYPVWVSPSQSLARVHFKITGGITPGSHVIWTRNGDQVQTDAVSGSSYDKTSSFSLAGPWTYVRAELRDANDARIAMTQPIFFRDTPDATPTGMSFHTLGVTTPSGAGYTKTLTKGITSSSWDGTARRLTFGLTNPAGSLAETRVRTAALDAQALTVDGTTVPLAATRADYDAATGSSWWLDPATHTVLVKARQTGGTGTVAIAFVPSADGTAPSQPTGLQAHVASSQGIDLSWNASTGDVDGYTVFRDGVPVADTTADTTTLEDRGLTGGTRYTYTVDAFDIAENHSAQSAPASATTDTRTTASFTPVADAYVDESNPTKKNGTSTALRIDGEPVLRTYVRFNLAGLQGRVENARLRVFANSLSSGFTVHSADSNWLESTITAANAPPPSEAAYGSGHVTQAGSWSEAEVTPMVTGNGAVTFALDTEVTSQTSYGSRESANPPQLIVDTSVRSNVAPVAGDATLTTAEDSGASWTPSVSDADNDTTTCSIVAQPAHGSASVASDCSSGSYLPAANYNGPDSFTYRATDSQGATSSSGTVAATVTPVNDTPTAADRTVDTIQDTGANWTPSVSDADGDTLTCEIVTPPTHGTALVNADCSGGTYTPASGYVGGDSFTYRASDPSNAHSGPGTVTATVASSNHAPTAANRSLSTPIGTPASWTPSVADQDGDALSCEIVAQPAHGTASVAADCSTGNYSPAAGYSGGDSFTYRAVDSHGTPSAPATVSATVTVPALFSDGFESGNLSAWTSNSGMTVQSAIVNSGSFAARAVGASGPAWAKRSLGATYSDVTYRLRFRSETTSPTGSPTVMRLRTAADKALATVYLSPAWKLGLRNDITATTKVSTTALQTGRWYDLEMHMIVNGTSSTIEVRVDGTKIADISSSPTDLGTVGPGVLQIGENNTGKAYDFLYDDVSASVVALNRSPTAADRTLSTAEDSLGAFTPSVTDPDGDATTCAIVSQPTHGTATVNLDCSGGSYTPAANYNGPDSFTYRATDSRGATSGTATVSATVTAVNDAPTAADRSLTTAEDTQGAWTPSVADVDGDALSCAIVTQPAHGTASVNSDCSGGTYTPAANYNGPDSFTYRSVDPSTAQASPATVSATVTAVNDAPTAADRTLTTAEDVAGSWTPNVADAEGDTTTCAIVSQPTHGTASVSSDCSGGTYTPAANYNGPDSFTYRATDSFSATSGTATVSATVTAVNDAPTAADRSLTTAEDTQGAWTPSVADVDGDALNCAIVTQPAHGTVAVSPDCSGGTYTPAANYSGPDSFTYRSIDPSTAQASPATVSATVTAVNDAPTAADRSLTTAQDVAGSWTPNVGDAEGDTLTCEIVAQPSHGTASVSSDCSGGTYTPASGYSGSDSFTYRAKDPSNASSSAATVTATVTPVNHAPTAADRSLSTNVDTQGSWTPSVADQDGDTVTCEIVAQPAHGSASVASNCSTGTYTPASGYSGGDSFTYRAVDSRGAASGPATVSATVTVPPLFSDGFESGNLSAWTSNSGLAVQSAIVDAGSFAGRAQSTNGLSWARRSLSNSYTDLTLRARFRTESSAPAGSPTVLRVRTATDKALATVYLTSARKIGVRNDITATTKNSATALQAGRWYDVELHVIVNGAGSTTELKVDGTKLTDASSSPTDLGTVGVGVLQIGENNTGKTYDFLYDDVVAKRVVGGGSSLRLAPRCGKGFGVTLSGPRRQRIARTGIVRVWTQTKSSCKVTAVAMTRYRHGFKQVRSRLVKTVLPAGRRGELTLHFSKSGRLRMKRALTRGSVDVVVYAGSPSHPVARRRVSISR